MLYSTLLDSSLLELLLRAAAAAAVKEKEEGKERRREVYTCLLQSTYEGCAILYMINYTSIYI